MKELRYSTNLKFYPNLNDIIPEFNVPGLGSYTDKVALPPSILNDIVSQQSALGLTSLPSPLVFKITTHQKKSCFVGVREFSALEDYIVLPHIIQEKLGISLITEELLITISLEPEIPKGSSLVLKPLDPDYDVSDWKYFLEARLNSSYTTLTKDDILYIKDNNKIYKLLIDLVEPAQTVSIIDTDIDLSIQPLNDEHARSMLTNRTKKIDPVELTGDIIVNDLKVDSDAYKFKIAPKQQQVIFQLVLRDQEFDISFIDLFVSNDKFVDKQNFLWSTLDADHTIRKNDTVQLRIEFANLETPEFIYVVPFLWNSRTIFEIRQVTEKTEIIGDLEEITLEENETLCQNCNSKVPKASLFLHENFCFRNNVKCKEGCGKVFHKTIPESHWHCQRCSTAFGDSIESFEHHNNIFHSDYTCECGEKFYDYPRYAYHRASDCEFKLHECQFCHLIVPRGKSTTMDVFKQVSHHENDCGSKTVDCMKCKKPVKLIDYESHMKLHDLDRISRPEPKKCSNVNCVKTSNINEFGLCDVCFGPSFSNVYDPTNAKLQSRFERRYVIQLSRGCGSTWCKNQACKSSGLCKFSSMGEIIKYVQQDLLPLIPHLPISRTDEPSYYFCVDSSMTKRKLLADWIFEEGQYSYNWCCRAVNQFNDEQNAKNWLQGNGVALHE